MVSLWLLYFGFVKRKSKDTHEEKKAKTPMKRKSEKSEDTHEYPKCPDPVGDFHRYPLLPSGNSGWQ